MSSSSPIPRDVAQFLTERVESVMELELLLFLRSHAGRPWDGAAIALELYIDRAAADQMLRSLAARSLIVEDEAGGYRYQPDAALRSTLDALADLYATRRVTVIGLIFAAPSAPAESGGLRQFSDAFRLRGPGRGPGDSGR